MSTDGTPSSSRNTTAIVDVPPVDYGHRHHGNVVVFLDGGHYSTPRSVKFFPGDEDVVRVSLSVDDRYSRSIIFRKRSWRIFRQVICEALLRDVADVDDLPCFLANCISTFLKNRMRGMPSADPLAEFVVHLNIISVPDQQPPDGHLPGAAATTAATAPREIHYARMLWKTTYKKSKKKHEEGCGEDVEGLIKETATACPICHEDFGDGEYVSMTPCGHPFHKDCLLTWLGINSVCPMCRTDMPHLYIITHA